MLVGLGADKMNLETSPFVTKNIKLLSSLGGTRDDLRIAYDLIGAGKFSPAVQEFAFQDINQALQMLRDGHARGRLFTRPRARLSST